MFKSPPTRIKALYFCPVSFPSLPFSCAEYSHTLVEYYDDTMRHAADGLCVEPANRSSHGFTMPAWQGWCARGFESLLDTPCPNGNVCMYIWLGSGMND